MIKYIGIEEGCLENALESAEKILCAYRVVSGLECGAVDLLDQAGYFSGFCGLCAAEQQKRDGAPVCLGMIPFSCRQSERWGGKYEWMCPVGLTFVSAMIAGGEQKTGVCAGPFLMTDRQEFVTDGLPGFFGGYVPEELRMAARKLPYIECARVSSFADVLGMLASYATERESIELRIMEQLASSDSEQFSSIEALKGGGDSRYPIEAEKELQNYIAQGDRRGAQRVLNEILGNVFFNSGGDFDAIKARTTELLVLLSRAAIEGGADISYVFGISSDYLKAIAGFRTLDELNNWLAGVLVRFTGSVFDFKDVRHSDLILNIIGYIRQNYMRKLSLNEISAAVHFSVSYISRVFREEMGISIAAFLNKVRVDNAKLLLLKEEIPLAEVAYLCGFEDQAYFNKVFKKHTGSSPGRYRDRRGKI